LILQFRGISGSHTHISEPLRRAAFCGAPADAAALRADGTEASWPSVLRYIISISQENPETDGGRLEPVRRYLARRMQMPVEVTGTGGYGVTIEVFRAKKIEASTMGPFAYVIGSERAGIEAIATRGTPSGELRLYAGTLSVAAASPLQSVDDLLRHARDLTVPSSTRHRLPVTWCNVLTSNRRAFGLSATSRRWSTPRTTRLRCLRCWPAKSI
jgi:ABC-type phosphate/phosphonate transport system substrate-binding protein